MSNNRGRHLYVTETLLGGPEVLVLSSDASTMSATASSGVHTTLTGAVPKAAGLVVTRHVSSIVSTSHVVIVGSKGISNFSARRGLLGGGRVCHSICSSRAGNKKSFSRKNTT